MPEYTNPDSLISCHEDGTIRIQATVPGEVEVFNRDTHVVRVLVERLPIPDGFLFVNNEKGECLYVKKSGQWYSCMNYGHYLASDNSDTWTYCPEVTDDYARAKFYQLKPITWE